MHVHVAHPDGEAKFWLLPEVRLANHTGLTVRQLREAQTPRQLTEAAHSFKGSCSNMGAVLLASLCKQLEDLARREQLDGVAPLLGHIEREFAIVRILFKGERQRHR